MIGEASVSKGIHVGDEKKTTLPFVSVDRGKMLTSTISSSRDEVGALGRTWTHLDALGRTWTQVDATGRIWTQLDAFGRNWTHFDANWCILGLKNDLLKPV